MSRRKGSCEKLCISNSDDGLKVGEKGRVTMLNCDYGGSRMDLGPDILHIADEMMLRNCRQSLTSDLGEEVGFL